MGLTRVAITRPLAILMLIVALVLLGLKAYTLMRQDRLPTISFPFVNVTITYQGAAPEDVQDLVTKPAEDAIAGVSGVFSINSTSREGQASINVQLAEGTDTNQAAQDIERRLAAIRNRLPDDVDAPTVRKADTSAFPVMNVALSGRPLSELHTLATDVVQPAIESVNGVADVQVVGGLQREVQVRVDSNKLRAFGLTTDAVSKALSRENVSVPGGSLDSGSSTQSVRTVGLYTNVDDLKRAPLTSGQKVVRLGDVAEVVDTFAQQTRLQRLNGQDAVGFIITKQADANGVQVSDDIKAALDRTQNLLPRGTTLQITNDTAKFTRRSLDAVLGDLRLAVILTGIVLLLFLHTFRPTIIVLLAIPTSLISTFLIMFFNGFSLNMISLMALALCIGILVDDSIVVLENIERHLKLGEPSRQAALNGRSEIGLAAIAITMVDVVVYVPVSFMSGNIGRLFREFGLTIAAATLFSLFMSFTLTPMFASRFMKSHEEHSRNPLAVFGRWWEAGYGRLANLYRAILSLALTGLGRPLVVLVAFTILVASLLMLQTNLVGSEYVPQEDDGQIQISITTPTGTSLQGTDQIVRKVEARLQQLPEVQTVFTSVGAGGGFNVVNVRRATMAVELKDKRERQRSISQVQGDIRRWGRDFPDTQLSTTVFNPLAGGGGSALNVRLLGPELGTLTDLATKYEQIIRQIPGAADINNDASQRDPELRAVVDRQRLSDLNVSATTVANSMKTAVGGTVVTEMRPPGEDQVDVRVLASDADRANANSLGSLPILSDSGQIVRLDQVARLVQDTGPAEINRTDRQLRIGITGNPSGRPLGDVTRDIRAATARIPLPEGYQVVYAGQVQQQELAFTTLLGTLVLSVVLIYMLMVALYESFLTPLAIMFAVPVALVGAILGLYFTGNTFNIFSLIGCIMLMGLVGKNAILLVDYTNTLRSRGLARREALLEAGHTRLRPILMTTATVIAAMIPLALKLEAGGESRAPMATVVIGGVISSTLLSLVLVPVMYTLLEDGKRLIAGALAWRPRRRPAAAPAAPAHAPAPSRGGVAASGSARVETRPVRGGSTD